MKPIANPDYSEPVARRASSQTLAQAADAARKERITAVAIEFADSGAYGNWRAIETALVQQGYLDASSMLADETLRGQLNVRCGGRGRRRLAQRQ